MSDNEFDMTKLDRAQNKPAMRPPPVNQSPASPSPSPPSHSSPPKELLGLIIGASFGLLIILLIILYFVWVRKMHKKKKDIPISSGNFTFADFAHATGGFSTNNIIGQGGFGTVFKGLLPNQKVAAIKRLNPNSSQGHDEFQAEVDIISRVSHRNLVSLIGYAIHGEERLLAYEYMPNETLKYHLRGDNGSSTLDWETRMQLAIGAAKGLAYLHEECSPQIIHRDVKSSNLLIDEFFEAKLSDFGLAKQNIGNNSHVSTTAKGSYGYLDPSYFQTNKLTTKTDVYSFGVVLLEIICGKGPLDSLNDTTDNYFDWAKDLLNQGIAENGCFDKLVDPNLQGEYDVQQMTKMAICVVASIELCSNKRPNMSQIVKALDDDKVSIEELKKQLLKPNEKSYDISQLVAKLLSTLSLKSNNSSSKLVATKGDEQV